MADGLLTIHDDGAIVHWAASSGESTLIALGEASVESVLVGDDGRALTVIDFFGRITTFDLVTGDSTVDERFGLGRPTGIAVSQTADRVAVSFDSGGVVLLDEYLAERAQFSAAPRTARIGDVGIEPTSGDVATALAERTGDRSFDDSATLWDGVVEIPRFSIGGESEDVIGCSAFSREFPSPRTGR